LKLDQLRALDAVVKAGSFAKAANDILLVTQPAVTRAIQNLEESIGIELFSRKQYRPQLTTQGQAFYERARQILKDVDALSAFSEQMSSGIEPELRIAVDTYYLLPHMLRAFHSLNTEYPDTRLHISCESLGASIQRLLDGEADLAVVLWMPEHGNYAHLLSQTLTRIRASTVVAPGFPLLAQTEAVSLQDLAPYVQVVERTNMSSPGIGINPHSQHWYVNDVHVKKQIILAGRSYGVLPYHLIEAELEQGLLLPFEQLEGYQVHEIELRAVCLKAKQRGPVLDKLWNKLVKRS
jgi:DNA-binding transcriptional LysR family regulator